MPALSDTDLRTLDRFLDDDETVQWAAQPQRRLAVGTAAEFGVAVGWTGFAVFWTFIATLMGGAQGPAAGGIFNYFGLFGIPFILVGLFLLAQPFLRARVAARTIYVVTDRRAVVAFPESGGMTVRTVPLGLFRTMQLTRRPDGSGTIRLDTDTPGKTNALGRYTPPFDFENVPDVDAAVDHIRALLTADGARLARPRPRPRNQRAAPRIRPRPHRGDERFPRGRRRARR